jgi:hypothetical protein
MCVMLFPNIYDVFLHWNTKINYTKNIQKVSSLEPDKSSSQKC